MSSTEKLTITMITLSLLVLLLAGVAGYKAIEYVLDNGIKDVASEIYNGKDVGDED